MSDIKLYNIKGEVKELSASSVNLEKELQTLIENNMETMFGVKFLCSEFSITNGRMDSIGIDENNCPVIFEYKRSSNENVINQGLFYLDWLLDHKAEFKLLVMEKLDVDTAKNIDWSAPCVICIANNFNKFDLHAVNQMQKNIKLVKYKKYDGLMLFEHLNAPNFSSIKDESSSGTPIAGSTVIRRDYNSKSQLEKYDCAPENIRNLYDDVCNYIESLGDDIQKVQTKCYLAFKKVRNIICILNGQSNVTLTLSLDPETVEKTDIVRNVTNIGHVGTGNVEVKVYNEADFEKIKPLIDRAYNEN